MDYGLTHKLGNLLTDDYKTLFEKKEFIDIKQRLKVARNYAKSIVNSGCIIGRVRELTSFFEESCDLLAASLYSSYALLDQASVNVIAYSFNNKFKMALHKNGEVVLNMCGVVDEKAEIRSGQIFLDGVRVPIVHQFDRFGNWSKEIGLNFHKREYRVQ
jgi:hypothetical protein